MTNQNETYLDIYRTMLTIRQFETMAGEMFGAGKIPGFIHLSIGQEASSVGVCFCLRADDYLTTTHRRHGHIIAKGADLKRMAAELFGKKNGYCKGKGGSMHIADFSIGILLSAIHILIIAEPEAMSKEVPCHKTGCPDFRTTSKTMKATPSGNYLNC